MKTQHISVYWVSKTNEFVSFIGVCEGKVFIKEEWKVRQGTENRKIEFGCLPPPKKNRKKYKQQQQKTLVFLLAQIDFLMS